MTTHTITGSISSYYVQAPITVVTVTSTGTVGAGGLSLSNLGVYTVANSGRIGTTSGLYGVLIPIGGTVINNLGATISGGPVGVSIGSGYGGPSTSSLASIVNNGTIQASGNGVYTGINVHHGNYVINGATNNTAALISGLDGILTILPPTSARGTAGSDRPGM
jgi:hypothetical protein